MGYASRRGIARNSVKKPAVDVEPIYKKKKLVGWRLVYNGALKRTGHNQWQRKMMAHKDYQGLFGA